MPRIAIIGSGFAGLGLGIQLKQSGIDTFTIFEKADSVGGTWRQNTYPGAECDIPSALYSYSFEGYDWPNKWSHQPVIRDYLEHCAARYKLDPHLRFGAEVTAARFDDHDAAWDVEINGGCDAGGALERFDIVVSATGQLSRPRWPDIDGLQSFGGDVFHSAEWDHDVDLTGKRVAVVGNAASATQFVPEIAPHVAELTVFQRSANWMIPKRDRDYSAFEKRLMRVVPAARKLRRFGLWFRSDILLFPLMRKKTRLRPLAEKQALQYLHETISDPVKREQLTPDYPIGAKRILFSDTYYEAIEAHDIAIETDPISKVTDAAVVTTAADGTVEEHEVDVVIVATGFQTQDFLTPMRVVGRDGRSLNDDWRDGPQAHLGISVHGYPNLFFLYGPNTNLGHSSIVLMIECQIRYLLSLIRQMVAESIQAVEVRAEVQEAYNAELAERLAETAWTCIDDSWYLQGGKVTNNWMGRTTEYWRRTRECDLADFTTTPMAVPAAR